MKLINAAKAVVLYNQGSEPRPLGAPVSHHQRQRASALGLVLHHIPALLVQAGFTTVKIVLDTPYIIHVLLSGRRRAMQERSEGERLFVTDVRQIDAGKGRDHDRSPCHNEALMTISHGTILEYVHNATFRSTGLLHEHLHSPCNCVCVTRSPCKSSRARREVRWHRSTRCKRRL